MPPEQLASIRNGIRGSLIQFLAGTAVVIGAFVTWRQYLLARGAAIRQQKVDHERQLTDRLLRAIDQLASERAPVRAGGALALEQLARDAPDEQPVIDEILASHVRLTLPAASVQSGKDASIPRLATKAPDAQAALLALGRTGRARGRQWRPDRLRWLPATSPISRGAAGLATREAWRAPRDRRNNDQLDCPVAGIP